MKSPLPTFLILSLLIVHPVKAVDYRKEIMENIIYPCYAKIADTNSSQFARDNKQQFIEILIMMGEPDIEHAIDTIIAYLPGKTVEQRQVLYRFGLANCLQGSGR